MAATPALFVLCLVFCALRETWFEAFREAGCWAGGHRATCAPGQLLTPGQSSRFSFALDNEALPAGHPVPLTGPQERWIFFWSHNLGQYVNRAKNKKIWISSIVFCKKKKPLLLTNRSSERVECILQSHLQNEKFLGGKIFALMTKNINVIKIV